MNVSVAEKYAGILFEWCLQRDMVDASEDALEWLNELMTESEDFRFVWLHPVLRAEMKTRIIEPAIREDVPEGVWAFLIMVMQRGRERFLPAILEQFRERALQERGIKAVDVYTARDLPEDVQKSLQSALSEREAMQVVLRQHRDPDLIAGLVVRVDDLKIDGSLRGRLRNIESILTSGNRQVDREGMSSVEHQDR